MLHTSDCRLENSSPSLETQMSTYTQTTHPHWRLKCLHTHNSSLSLETQVSIYIHKVLLQSCTMFTCTNTEHINIITDLDNECLCKSNKILMVLDGLVAYLQCCLESALNATVWLIYTDPSFPWSVEFWAKPWNLFCCGNEPSFFSAEILQKFQNFCVQ